MTKRNGMIMKVVGISITIILAFTSYIVANDRMSRERDDAIKYDLNEHIIKAEEQFHAYAMKQEQFNSNILVKLEGIAKDIQYMKTQ